MHVKREFVDTALFFELMQYKLFSTILHFQLLLDYVGNCDVDCIDSISLKKKRFSMLDYRYSRHHSHYRSTELTTTFFP